MNEVNIRKISVSLETSATTQGQIRKAFGISSSNVSEKKEKTKM